MNNPLISFIIPCAQYHSQDLWANSKTLLNFGERIEVIVVHDWEGMDLKAPNLRSFETPSTFTRSQNRNVGAQNARAQWLVFMDADVSISQTDLEDLYYALEQNPGFIAATVAIDTKAYGGCFPGLNAFLERFKRMNRNSLQPKTLLFPVLDGAFIVVKKEVFNNSAKFKDDLFWNEDALFSHSIAEQTGLIIALDKIEVQETFHHPKLHHFIWRYFLSGLGNSLFFASYLNQSRWDTFLIQLRAAIQNLSNNYQRSNSGEEKTMVILLRSCQILGALIGLFYPATTVPQGGDFRAKVMTNGSIYAHSQNSWRKLI